MKKFALLLVTATLVLSCGNRKSGLLFGVREMDFVGKAKTTVQGTVVDAEWPLSITNIAVCDSFLVVNTDEKGAQMYVYSDDCELLGRFCFIGRAKNEFFRSAKIMGEQTFKDADGNTLIPLIDYNYGVKVMNLQESVKNHNTTIVTENRYTNSRIVYVFKDDDGYGAIPAVYSSMFLDDDINHAFEDYLYNDFNGTVYVYPHYAVMNDTAKVKEIWLFDKTDKNYSENLIGNLYKHPKRNLIIKPLLDMDYILFFDLDNDTTFAVHQSGSRSFKDGVPPLVVKEVPLANGDSEMVGEMVPHFGDVAFAESFFMVLYYATDFDVSKPDDGGKDSCELMFFDWDGNFLKSVELDHFVSNISYDESKKVLYAVEDWSRILSFDLSSVL